VKKSHRPEMSPAIHQGLAISGSSEPSTMAMKIANTATASALIPPAMSPAAITSRLLPRLAMAWQ